MLHIDLPTRDEIARLAAARAEGSVSIYLRTTPVTQETQASRIEFGNLLREAEQQLQAADFDKRQLARLMDPLRDLADDDEFWKFQANSLAVFATPDRTRTYRLANELTSMVQVADRFHLKPLLRARTFDHGAFVLSLSEHAVSLMRMYAGLPPEVIRVPDMPASAASAAGKSTLNDRTFTGRIHGSEGQNVRFAQYVRKVDAALRPVLAGQEVPLVLAATGRLADIFRQMNSYPNLLDGGITESPDRLAVHELAEKARPVLDAAYEAEIAAIRALYAERAGLGRATSDVAGAARAATFGAVDTLLVNIDSVVPGFVDDETGAVTFVDVDDAAAYGVVDEIAGRALAQGARVLGVRAEDLPEGEELAAILRYAL
ncbi:MAG: hypothetical protein H3C51_12470 [Rubellimicrobium sp.]|nr:hypothetical protein [Rubellimicrobium sp.]